MLLLKHCSSVLAPVITLYRESQSCYRRILPSTQKVHHHSSSHKTYSGQRKSCKLKTNLQSLNYIQSHWAYCIIARYMDESICRGFQMFHSVFSFRRFPRTSTSVLASFHHKLISRLYLYHFYSDLSTIGTPWHPSHKNRIVRTPFWHYPEMVKIRPLALHLSEFTIEIRVLLRHPRFSHLLT